MRPSFPSVIDSSMMSAFRSCPRKFELEYLLHWKPKAESVHLVAGKAFARGLEVAREAYYVHGERSDVAVAKGLQALLTAYGSFECPPDSAKSAARMAGALEFYFEVWPMEQDKAVPVTLPSGARGIEFSFLEPLALNHPETGDPILFSGRFDMLVDYAGGRFGEDDKTTSSLGDRWSNQWDLRSQFTAYCWGAAMSGMPLAGVLVRGESILKTKYDKAQAVTYRPAWQIERWYEQTLRDVRRMIASWEEGYWDYNLDNACNEYGGCMFKTVCVSQEPQKWLEVGFEQRRWDPVTREETKL